MKVKWKIYYPLESQKNHSSHHRFFGEQGINDIRFHQDGKVIEIGTAYYRLESEYQEGCAILVGKANSKIMTFFIVKDEPEDQLLDGVQNTIDLFFDTTERGSLYRLMSMRTRKEQGILISEMITLSEEAQINKSGCLFDPQDVHKALYTRKDQEISLDIHSNSGIFRIVGQVRS